MDAISIDHGQCGSARETEVKIDIKLCFHGVGVKVKLVDWLLLLSIIYKRAFVLSKREERSAPYT